MTTPNTQPQFAGPARVSSKVLSAANSKSDGSGTIATDEFLVFSPATNDSFLDDIWLMPTATAAGTALAQSSVRVYLSTQSSGATTSANTTLIAEATLPAVTGDSLTVGNPPIVIPIGKRIPSTLFVLIQVGTAPNASTSWVATAFGRDF